MINLRSKNLRQTVIFSSQLLVILVLLAIQPTIASATPPSDCRGVTATFVGTDGNDDIWGTAGDDVIQAGDGVDAVHGLAGDDLICGGPGDDNNINGNKGGLE